VLVLAACIVNEERFRVVKEENSAQHIFPASVPDELRMASRIPHRNAEMVIAPTHIVGDPWLCPGKYKNSRFTVATDLILDKC
jgi:hypothetical protein